MQNFLIVNLDRREFLRPTAFGDGPGLLEFGASGSGTMLGLALLLASGRMGGPHEFRSDNPLIGSWSACRISIAGSDSTEIYTELRGMEGRALEVAPVLYEVAEKLFVDISSAVVLALCEEPYERRALANRGVAIAKSFRSASRSGQYPMEPKPTKGKSNG